MRIAVPNCNIGKSGGYRTIYRTSIIDEFRYIVFLSVYFKGDQEDLTKEQYSKLLKESDEVLSSPILYDWEDFLKESLIP